MTFYDGPSIGDRRVCGSGEATGRDGTGLRLRTLPSDRAHVYPGVQDSEQKAAELGDCCLPDLDQITGEPLADIY